MADNRCLALILAPKRQVNDTGRISLPVTSITVITKELKKAVNDGTKLRKERLEGVVNEHNQNETHLKFLTKKEEIKNSDTKKVKFKKEVVLLSPTKNSKFSEATAKRKTKNPYTLKNEIKCKGGRNRNY